MYNKQLEICGLLDTLEISLCDNSENCKAKENGAKISSCPVRSRSEQCLTYAPSTLLQANEHPLRLIMSGLDTPPPQT